MHGQTRQSPYSSSKTLDVQSMEWRLNGRVVLCAMIPFGERVNDDINRLLIKYYAKISTAAAVANHMVRCNNSPYRSPEICCLLDWEMCLIQFVVVV